MKIAEIYLSIQGEGLLTGTESVFVRASGCNLRCWFCDTPFASWTPEGDDLAVDEILARVEELDCGHVVLTGGEPMLFAELLPLAGELKRRGLHITVETAGTLYLPVESDLMSISPKLSNSAPRGHHPRWRKRHERTRHAPAVVRRLLDEYAYQLKFVVHSPADCQEVERYLDHLPGVDRSLVLLMPQGIDSAELAAKAAWLKPYCQQAGVRYCPRRQIEWFGLVRGT
ncbi:MAG TPA: 7-carboxy-7-deazaguanine synthase QueE [Pirellulales bacterium]|jgi:7-carboxy-7-deazaguanine synthase|nr:7-carboxy-7-deazaguanine synthase QueE [Pirellulales bacterium]